MVINYCLDWNYVEKKSYWYFTAIINWYQQSIYLKIVFLVLIAYVLYVLDAVLILFD